MFIVSCYNNRLRVKFQSGQFSSAIAMNPFNILAFCIKFLNIFVEISALEGCVKKNSEWNVLEINVMYVLLVMHKKLQDV